MKVHIKRPIRMILDRTKFKEDDGDLYYTVEPGVYDLAFTGEHYPAGDRRIGINITLTASFWTEGVGEDEYEVEEDS